METVVAEIIVIWEASTGYPFFWLPLIFPNLLESKLITTFPIA
jgi:hypothetical protein